MELTAAHAMQFVMLVGTIAGGYAVVKSQLSRVMGDLESHIKGAEAHKTDFDMRLDEAESQRAVFNSQIEVLKEINSVKSLEIKNRELATMQAQIHVLQHQVDHLQSIHNGKHPKIDN
jgi:ubiquinone biosynthesis protein UbiJ|tara:strand:+ start:3022 stop:3375 length:354 start_codon:yes stop_codon:yes gene_type:complete